MKSGSWMVAAGAALACQVALADLPDVLDRVPADATVVFVVPNLGELAGDIARLETMFGEEIEGGPIDIFEQVMSLESVDAARGGAMFIPAMPGGFDPADGDPPQVVLLPVNDFAGFIGAMGGTPGEGIVSLDIDGTTAFARDVGAGYAAIGPVREAVESYTPAGGARAAHTARLGAVASQRAGESDVFVCVDVNSFQDQIRQTMQQISGGLMAMAMQTGHDVGPQMAMVEALRDRIIGDGQVAFLAFDLGESGFGVDAGMQFKEGSDTAVLLRDPGDASRLIARLPDKPFLFAAAVDASSPSARELAMAMSGFQKMGIPGLNPNELNTKGTAMLLGEIPGGLMSGMLLGASTIYFDTDDSAALAAQMKSSIEAINGQTVEGVAYTTSYEAGAGSVDGVSLDGYSVQMDAGDAMNMQMKSMMQMFFGAGNNGPAGFVAKADKGVVVTMAKNSTLAGEAIKAANGADGLGANASIKSVAAELPSGRTAEVYLGVGKLAEMAFSVMAMQMGPVDIEIPEDLAPVGIGVASQQGGVDIRLFAPTSVLELVQSINEAMNANQAPGPPEEGSGPRF